MKRSEINRNIEWAIDTCKKLHFNLPAFAFWTPEEWKNRRAETEHMVSVAQGWDVTDYATGTFDKVGAVLFTLRNGNIYDKTKGTPFCEKIIAMKDGQLLPLHFHYSKTEDIINRCGGILCVTVYNSKKVGDDYVIDKESDVHLRLDGIPTTISAGGTVEITNGNSITLTPYIYHKFCAKGGDLIVGEVSSINDDAKDNHFETELNLTIEEDEPVRHVLCGGYVQK
ncbi:MAG: D-lyxose/D-mannose family sugar isomerase [Oscillospiraceae bacterium]|nr:D-lyxose/D-mannose family sugar isomerase [Oscillospiraceae bacterium]